MTENRFFAASVGGAGFCSRFGEIFSPDRYDAVYIIKGGPGTGKSTFMKKIGEEAERRSRAFEEETDREFLDPDFKRTPAPGFRVRGYILSIRYPTPLDPGLQFGHVDEEDEDCAGCFLWGTVVPDDDPEPVVEKPFGPAEEESWPLGEM